MDERIERYKEYRNEGQELNSKLFDALIDDEVIEAARFLGMIEDQDGEEVVDLKLSQTASPDSLIFLRPVPLPEMTITSGFLLPFQAEAKDHLLEVHQKVMIDILLRVNAEESQAWGY